MMAFGDRSHGWSKYALEPRDAATARRTCGARHFVADPPRHGPRPASAAPRRTGGGAREAPRKSGASPEMRRLDIISAADGDGRSGIDADQSWKSVVVGKRGAVIVDSG